MKEYPMQQIRNIGIVGHGSEGKTTLAEAMLFLSGATDRMGKVDDGSAVTDYDPEEIKRNISISAALAPVEWKNCKINAVDIPGYFDFIGEAAGALSVVDAAMIVVNAVSGLAVGTEKAWDYASKYGIAKCFVVNQMDRENASFEKVVDALKAKYGVSVVPISLPIIEGASFTGVVDVVAGKGRAFGAKGDKEIDIPAALSDEAAALREQIAEAAAGSDDELMEKYFEEGTLGAEEIRAGLRKGIAAGVVVPVLCTAANEARGVAALMDAIADYLPSPADMEPPQVKNLKTEEVSACKADPAAPFVAQVFKTVADPFVGKLSLFRIYGGTLTSDMSVFNANVGKNEKAGNLYTMMGKKQITLNKLCAGDIGAMAKLQHTATGHTLCEAGTPVLAEEIEFPKPSISLAVKAKKQGDEDKIFSGLYRLEEEDPTFKVAKADTGDMLISGQGELHLEVICAKLKNKFSVEAVLEEPIIPYRETIRKTVKAQGRHKKQSGGHGQFGDVWIEFSPILDGDAGFEFVDKVVGGVVPRQFIPAVEKGLREVIHKGVLAGYPVVNLRATLYDGSYHSVDSSEMAFKVAASQAFKKGLSEANPVLLEPIYHVEVMIPDEYMGDIIGDLNRRRGRIMGMNPMDGAQQVVAEVPLSEMFKYATDLRSMTQARGSFAMTFERYEEVPGNISAKVIEQAKRDEEEE